MTAFALSLVLFQLLTSSDVASAQTPSSIYGKVVDATTGLAIPNTTVLIWDLDTLDQPKLGAGIYFTDENGAYEVSAPYLKVGHTYWIYVYKGDFAAKAVDYVPSVKKEIFFETSESKNLSFTLVPGALIECEGIAYLAQSSSPEESGTKIKVLSEDSLDGSFMSQYGAGVTDVWFLGLSKEMVIVPANTPVVLEAEVWYYSREPGRIITNREVFPIYNGSLPFLLPQGYTASLQIPSYSLRGGVEFVESAFVEISSQLDIAQSIGFVVFEERRSASSAYQTMSEARESLNSAQTDKDYLKVWAALRTALGNMTLISNSLENKRLISRTSAVYLSAIMATFGAVLSFFFFEEKKRKMLSSIAIYAFFLMSLYFFYPGAHLIIDENVLLFAESAAISFLGVSAIIFGLPYVWKERRLEGEVPWRSAISLIFSMGKRQIRRKKIRGFFTIMSIIILILAFTSLTSFGTAFGIVSDELSESAPSDGVMVKRMLNESSLEFAPLGFGDPAAVSKIIDIGSVAVRLKNIPSFNPVARLVNPQTKIGWFIHGVLGITPTNESMYTQLDQTVEGNYLSDDSEDEILVSASVADSLGIRAGENLTFEVLGTRVSTSFTVTGVIDDEGYMNLADMDGSPLGPIRLLEDGSARRCNSTEIAVMSAKATENLQREINIRHGEGAPQFVVLSDFVFQLGDDANLREIIGTLIFGFTYDVFVSSNRIVTYHHVGAFIELKGAAELLIPLIMVGLNVSMVMMNAVYERRKEIRTLSMLGLNPTHIGLIFVAEAIILGMVGGSLGYLFGLGFYRVMALFGQELMVREKLEWWWSAIGFALALAASVLSSIRPAALAVSTYTPSKVKRVKRTEKETKARKEEIFKVYQARQLSMPVKVLPNEKEFFIGFFLGRLNELKTGYLERVENVEEPPEIENIRREIVRTINFDYLVIVSGKERRTINSLILTKSPKEDYFRTRLATEPAVPGLPESAIERTIDFVHEAILYWAKNKDRFIGGL